MTGLNMQKDIFSKYELWHLPHFDGNGLSVRATDG